jgi:hypothetical protein
MNSVVTNSRFKGTKNTAQTVLAVTNKIGPIAIVVCLYAVCVLVAFSLFRCFSKRGFFPQHFMTFLKAYGFTAGSQVKSSPAIFVSITPTMRYRCQRHFRQKRIFILMEIHLLNKTLKDSRISEKREVFKSEWFS